MGLCIKALPVIAALTASACSTAHRYDQNCLNEHVSPNYGEVHSTPGGFAVTGSGVTYTPIEAGQTATPLRPGTAGDPADDFPKPKMRTFDCRQVQS